MTPDAHALDLGALAADPRAVGRVALPARHGATAPWPDWIDPGVRRAYEQKGIRTPWRHQVRTAEHARAGRHVIVSTGTASGKSAAFGMAALSAALEAPEGAGRRGPGVLYLAPTKALAHDQLAGLAALGLPGLRAGALDGDTPEEQRAWVRSHARWIVSNPDMLHRGLVPRHETWRGFLRALRFVVVDEAHVYRGLFGSHVALVLRRLARVAALHGAQPTFIAASATVADPGRTARQLLGVDVEVVDTDDSARGPVDLVLWNPSRPRHGTSGRTGTQGGTGGAEGTSGAEWTDGAGGAGGTDPTTTEGIDVADPDGATGPSTSTLAQAADLMGQLVDSGVATLTFTRSRRAVEIVAGQVRDRARNGARVRAYRGGYLPEERRALEADLREGRLLGLAATSALELGIDISGLGAVVLAGWPGTRSSFWQQVGRAGRRGGSALAILIAREDPLDQYVVGHPEILTGRSVEAVVLDPDNPYVLAGHLCAAAAEAPLTDDTIGLWFGPMAHEVAQVLGDRGVLRRRQTGWYWTDPSRPVDVVDLRGDAGGPTRVVEESTGRLLGTVDTAQAPMAVHPGALYVHQGSVHEILDWDPLARVATAVATTTDLSTHARSTSDVAIESVDDTTRWGPVDVARGQVRVTTTVHSYLVRRWPSGQVIAEHRLDLPETTLHTRAMWWSIPDDVLRNAGIDSAEVPGAVHALEHAAIGILPLLATCDRWDLGGVSSACHPQTGQAIIVVHDGHQGGAGFADRGYAQAVPWLTTTRDAIAGCPCDDGCPSCVQSPKCGNGNTPLDKAAALLLAEVLLARGRGPTTDARSRGGRSSA